MPRTTQPRLASHGVLSWGGWALAFLTLLCLAPALLHAQAAPETVGRIEGDDIAVKGAVSVEFVNGQNTTMLGSGSDVTVRSGQARIVLVEGGEIGICGPAHFSLLKSGGAITLALDYGRVHARLEDAVGLAVFTPLIVATPIAIAGGRDATVGLEASGAMCVLAARGAVRVEQQLTGQSLLVPQSGEIQIADGQLETLRGGVGTCQCEILSARAERSRRPAELSVPLRASAGHPPAQKRDLADAPEPPRIPADEEPIYKVFMPPLTFNAAAPEPPPDPSPESIVLAREVRVRPSIIFRGHVEAATLPPATPPPGLAATGRQDASPKPKKERGLVARIVNFFKRWGSRSPCAGVGCS
jgi:hypothetical protein